MNQDHQAALHLYCDLFAIKKEDKDTDIKMIYFDQEGMWLQSTHKNHYISFDHVVTNMSMLRAVLVAMTKKAKQQQAMNEQTFLEKVV